MSDRRVVQARVSGRVQGVGFRWFVLRSARALDLAGWVRNTDEGAVEVCAAGDAGRVDELLEALRRGPAHASVRTVDVEERPASEAPSNAEFEILP